MGATLRLLDDTRIPYAQLYRTCAIRPYESKRKTPRSELEYQYISRLSVFK